MFNALLRAVRVSDEFNLAVTVHKPPLAEAEGQFAQHATGNCVQKLEVRISINARHCGQQRLNTPVIVSTL